jgi:hypothetical protein
MTFKISMMTVWASFTSGLRRLVRRLRPGGPPPAGVREPRRPRPTLPAAAVALAEPKTRRWFRLR